MNKYTNFEMVCDCGVTLTMRLSGDDKVLIEVSDQERLLGRLLISADEVMVLQPNEILGPTIEWVGLP